MDLYLALGFHADLLQHGGMGLQKIEFLAGQFRIAPLHFEVLLRIEISDHDHTAHAEAISAHVGDVFGDVVVHAVDDGHNGNKGGSGQNDAQERQEAAELAGVERCRCAAHSFPKGCVGFHLIE